MLNHDNKNVFDQKLNINICIYLHQLNNGLRNWKLGILCLVHKIITICRKFQHRFTADAVSPLYFLVRLVLLMSSYIGFNNISVYAC